MAEQRRRNFWFMRDMADSLIQVSTKRGEGQRSTQGSLAGNVADGGEQGENVRWPSEEEMKDRRWRNPYFCCDAPSLPDHGCQNQQLCAMVVGKLELEEGETEEEEGEEEEEDEEDAEKEGT